MERAITISGWVNKPSTTTPLGQNRLNEWLEGTKEVDRRVCELDITKASAAEIMQSFVNVSLDEGTGTFTFTRKDGSVVTIETKISKITTNWKYDEETKSLILYLDDGTEQRVDLSALITQLDFIDSETIAFTVSMDGKVTARIKKGSITGEYLDPDYLAGIVENVNTAKEYMDTAGEYALDSKRWAVGDGSAPESATDNSKYYAEQAAKSAALAEQTVAINLPQVYVDTDTMELMGKTSGYMLYLDDDGVLWGGVESA